MRRLLLGLFLLLIALPARAQNCITVNGVTQCLGPYTFYRNGIATTSTDGEVLANNRASTAGVPVQQSPRLRFRSHVWNTTVTAADNTNDWWIESVPTSGTTPSGTLKIGSSLNGAATTFPLTIDSGGSGQFAGNVRANSANYMGFLSRTTWNAPGDGTLNITTAATTIGIGFDFTTDSKGIVRNRAQNADAIWQASQLIASGAGITAGAHATVTTVGGREQVTTAVVTATTCNAQFKLAGTTADCTIATLPAKTRLIAVYADVTAGFTCSGTCTGTKTIGAGKTAGGTEILASGLSVATTNTQYGLADADLGTAMVRAAAIQGGYLNSWSATTPVIVRFTSGTGNWGDGSVTFVNAGSVTFYLETVVLP